MTDVSYSPARSRSIGEVLDTTFRIFQRTLIRTLPFGALAILLGQLANIYQLVRHRPLAGYGTMDRTSWFLFVVGNLLVAVVWYALLSSQNAIISGQRVSFGAELVNAVRRFPEIAVLLVLQFVSIVAGVIALLVPALYLMVPLGQSWPILVIEKTSAIDACRTALRLTHGSWWRVATTESVAMIVVLVFCLVGTVVIGVIRQFDRPGDLEVFYASSTTMSFALGALLLPFSSALLIAIHFDLRERESAKKAATA